MNRFRVVNGAVYEYSKKHNAYIFCGKLNGRSLAQFKKNRKENPEI